MIFNTYGDATLPSLMMIHGMANTAQSCYGRIVPYLDDYHVILCEVDGHTDKDKGLFISIDDFSGEVTFWYGSNEHYPRKTAELLKRHLPQMQEEVFEGMGHGQLLNEHPEEYVQKMKDFIN